MCFEVEDFFLTAASLDGAEVGLSRFHQRLGARCLGTRIGVVQYQQKLSRLDEIAFLDEHALHAGRGRSVSFEIVDGLDFPVRRNQAANVGLLHDRRAHRHGVIAVPPNSSQHDDGRQNWQASYPPAPR